MEFQGSATYVLKEKFKMLRNRLRWWNKRVFIWVDLNIDEGVNTLNDVEAEMERDCGMISDVHLLNRSVAQEGIWNNLHLKESMIKHKYRLKWVKEGDLNTKYFHSMLNCRTRKNSITSIKV